MLTISSILLALTSTTTEDPNTIFVVIGIAVVVLLLLLVSLGSPAKKVVKKYYCPHCNRQIDAAPPSAPVKRQGKNLRLSSQPVQAYSGSNQKKQKPAQVIARDGKKYCPYCKKKIIWD